MEQDNDAFMDACFDGYQEAKYSRATADLIAQGYDVPWTPPSPVQTAITSPALVPATATTVKQPDRMQMLLPIAIATNTLLDWFNHDPTIQIPEWQQEAVAAFEKYMQTSTTLPVVVAGTSNMDRITLHICSSRCNWSKQGQSTYICTESGHIHICTYEQCAYRVKCRSHTTCSLTCCIYNDLEFQLDVYDRAGTGDQYSFDKVQHEQDMRKRKTRDWDSMHTCIEGDLSNPFNPSYDLEKAKHYVRPNRPKRHRARVARKNVENQPIIDICYVDTEMAKLVQKVPALANEPKWQSAMQKRIIALWNKIISTERFKAHELSYKLDYHFWVVLHHSTSGGFNATHPITGTTVNVVAENSVSRKFIPTDKDGVELFGIVNSRFTRAKKNFRLYMAELVETGALK